MQNSWLERRDSSYLLNKLYVLAAEKVPRIARKRDYIFFRRNTAFAWPLFQTPSNYYSSSFHYADFSFPHLQVALGASTVVQQQQAVGESCCTHQNSLLFRLLATTIVLGEERASSSSFSSLLLKCIYRLLLLFPLFQKCWKRHITSTTRRQGWSCTKWSRANTSIWPFPPWLGSMSLLWPWNSTWCLG